MHQFVAVFGAAGLPKRRPTPLSVLRHLAYAHAAEAYLAVVVEDRDEVEAADKG